VEKSGPNNLRRFCHFQKAAQSKQLPDRRKFAQSGHPGSKDEPGAFEKQEQAIAMWLSEA
jgi:hypothetical protein